MALSESELAEHGVPAAATIEVGHAPGLEPPPIPAEASRYVPVSPWPPFLAIGMTVLNFALVLLLGMIPVVAVTILHLSNGKTFDIKHPIDLADPFTSHAFMLTLLLSQAAGTAMIFWASRWRGGQPARILSLRQPIGGSLGYLWTVPFVFFGMGCGLLVQWLWPQSNQADTQLMLQLAHSPAWWLMGLVAIAGAPLYEELAFRGFLFASLARTRLGLIGTALVTSLLWATMHAGYSLQGIATIFALGLALSFILWRTGSTRVTMACHGCYNAMAFIAALWAVPGAT